MWMWMWVGVFTIGLLGVGIHDGVCVCAVRACVSLPFAIKGTTGGISEREVKRRTLSPMINLSCLREIEKKRELMNNLNKMRERRQ